MPGAEATTVTKQVVEAMYRMLRSGRYQVGDRLPGEWELVKQLGVGRSAVREAMRELAALDLVEIRRGRGTFVSSLRADLLLSRDSWTASEHASARLELLEVRKILEPEAAALAAERATSADIERLEHDVERLREAVNSGFRPPEDLGFHLDVSRATHNHALSRVAWATVSYYERGESLPTERDVREHASIYLAIKRRDPSRARQMMRAHLVHEIAMQTARIDEPRPHV